MPAVRVAPDDERLRYSGYVDLDLTAEHAVFSRRYAGNLGGFADAARQAPGATLRFRTNAHSVAVLVRYTSAGYGDQQEAGTCSEFCAITNERACYTSSCTASCAVTLYVDGERVPTRREDGFYQGDVRVAAMSQAQPTAHHYELIMPWAAAVEFRGLELSSTTRVPEVLPSPPAPSFLYVAYGDSITHGWCSESPYPELIARRNGWRSVNLGIAGMGAQSETVAQHGAAIARQGGDLVTVAIGTNDFWWCGNVEEPLRQTIAGIRHGQSTVPIVLITPLRAFYEARRWWEGARPRPARHVTAT